MWGKVDGYNKENLKLDFYGIICDVALKKGLKESLKDCIDHAE